MLSAIHLARLGDARHLPAPRIADPDGPRAAARLDRFWRVGVVPEPDTCPGAIGHPSRERHTVVRRYDLDGVILGFRSDDHDGPYEVPIDERLPAGCDQGDEEPVCECIEVVIVNPLPPAEQRDSAPEPAPAEALLPVSVALDRIPSLGGSAGAA